MGFKLDVQSGYKGGSVSEAGPQIWLGDDGILRVRYPPDFNLTLAAMEEIHRQRLEMMPAPCPLLVYADSVAAAEYEAQQFASRDDVAALVTAMAIIVKSLFTRAMSDLFMRFHRPPYPTRIFRDEQSALKWLAQYQPENKVSDSQPGL